MAIKANTGLVSQWYTPIGEREEDQPARFKLKPLDQMTYLEVISSCEQNPDGTIAVNRRALDKCLKSAIEDWEQVFDQSEKPLKCSWVNHKHLPYEILVELFQEVLTVSTLTEDDKKN